MDPLALTDLAAAQAGVFSREQATSLGLSSQQLQRRVAAGRWQRLLPAVYGIAGYPVTWRRRLWAAHLHAGPESVLSHETAGRLQGFGQVPPGLVVLITPQLRARSPEGVRWHRYVDLDPSDVQALPGLPPVTTATRTVLDLAGVLHVARLRSIVEQGVLERRFDVAAVGVVLDRVRRQGKSGIRPLASVLDDLGPGDGIPHSELERLADRVIDLAGLPEPAREYPLPNNRGRTGFVDRCWPDVRWIVEADGRRWHDRNAQAAADAGRSLEAQAVGFETSRLRWEHLAHDPDGTARLLRQVFDQRAALLARD